MCEFLLPFYGITKDHRASADVQAVALLQLMSMAFMCLINFVVLITLQRAFQYKIGDVIFIIALNWFAWITVHVWSTAVITKRITELEVRNVDAELPADTTQV